MPCFDFNFSNCDPVILVFRFLGLICFGSPITTLITQAFIYFDLLYTIQETWKKLNYSVPSHIIQRRWLFCLVQFSSFSQSSRNWSKKFFAYKMKCWPEYLGQISNNKLAHLSYCISKWIQRIWCIRNKYMYLDKYWGKYYRKCAENMQLILCDVISLLFFFLLHFNA